MPDLVDFLGQLDIFGDLDEDELEALAVISEPYSFEKGAIVAYQRDVSDSMTIVRRGRLFAFEVDEHGRVRNSRSYLPGQYYGEARLFTESTHPYTVRAGSDGRLVQIRGEAFRNFLERHPRVIGRLNLSDEAKEAAAKSRLAAVRREFRAVSLMPDELIEYWARRTPWLLVVSAFIPALVAIGFFGVAGAAWYGNQTGQTDWSILVIGVLVAIGFAFFGVVIFQVLDWRNDYFVITNKQIVHHEFSLRTFRTSNDKIPLDRVQSVEVVKPNLLATLLNVGMARITTAAVAGVLYFDYIDNPEVVRDTINRLRERVLALDEARIQETLRRTVEDHFNVESSFELEQEELAELPPPSVNRRPSLFERISRGFRSRVEVNGVINYRKHSLVLLRETWMLVLPMLLIILVDALIYARDWLPILPVCLASGLPFVILAGLFVWRLEDWRNEIFQISEFYVVDVDRLPFGFGESRKQAELNNIQNVNAIRPSLFATLFNYGDVEIEVAGIDANIVFESVVNPERVQSDVFQRQEQARRKLRLREGSERRKEYAVLLDVYQQAREQQRIPQRTPDLDAEPGDTDETGNGRPGRQ